jgi:uncharacterized membrane protein YkvA (DUF1232 family)
MSNKTTQINNVNPGLIEEIALRAKLTIRLMLDKRVSPWLKLLPIGSLIYLINPIDIPGPFDDIAVVGFGFYMFFQLCPPAIVKEHMADLHHMVNIPTKDSTLEGDVVDAEFHEVSHEAMAQDEGG